MNKALIFSILTVTLSSGCTDDNILLAVDGSTTPNSGIIAADHFALSASTVNPQVLDTTSGFFFEQEVTLTVNIGDRNNQLLTDSHTIFFRSEYGLIDPSCTTSGGDGECTVKWTAIKRPETGGPGADGTVDITAYTVGEEAFFDANGNGTYDDTETFTDTPEPFVDNDNDGTGVWNSGDSIINVPNATDPSGTNTAHDTGDMKFNGAGCTHSTDCSTRTSTYIFEQITLTITFVGT